MAHEAGLADQYAVQWESNDSPPDVFAYLEQHSEASVPEKLAVLLSDQQHRWKTDQPLKVENYLAQLPDLASDQGVKLELAVGEFRARQDSDTVPSIGEFTSRFPDLADSLRSKLSEVASDDGNGERQREVTTTETFISDATIGDRQIGRYRLSRKLGEGAFGVVWLAFDEELQRQVAIKVPTRERFQKPEDAETYLAEARTVASLDHANIVPVHDVGRTGDGSIYVVSKLIEGRTLSDRIKQDRPGHEEATRLLATVAQALHHAHQKRLIHRDVKPGNILIEESTGTPYVADFGLAISEEDYLRDSKIAGTPAYMSPEQARGEGHRLDGRSDIFSLGVVFYQLLTGRRPFRGGTHNELFHQIVSVAPTPPREIDDSIPVELARICLKSLSKRASDRYSTAAELADDLLHWKSGLEVPIRKEVKIVPKGLRSFDADDAEFFLQLLPGPHDRDGLPESIRFWKTRIEETDADKTFNVGLIYGPSGCGKSSLVKAGLLPRLSDQVITIYVEATPEETETRILRGLRKQVPELPDDLGLGDTFAALRRGTGTKAVVVLDQFEQWLHAHRAEQETELVSALRQCDGGNIQCIVMVRDDFAMAAARFMDSLDIPILQGHNFATVDLFDIDHAQNTLARFGQAFGKLPAQLSGLSEAENEFLASVASGLSQDGKMVSVRLALFAEMVKGKPWVPTTLEEIGGTEGIGVSFLEETFSSRTANPKHRLHQQAAREVLKALLPEVGTDIKGHMRSHAELLEASGYQNHPANFNDLLRILDGELRLITPTDPEGFQTDSGSDPNSKYYQLTHDYLVPSLREWLTRKQKETRRGRAELRLAERSAMWCAKPENRHLPAWWEYLNIRLLTSKHKWNDAQRRMMGKAGRTHGLRWAVALLVLVGITVGGQRYLAIQREREDRMVQDNNQKRAESLVNAVLTAPPDAVPYAIQNLAALREYAVPILRTRFGDASLELAQRLHAAYALAEFGESDFAFPFAGLKDCSPGECPNVVKALEEAPDAWLSALDDQIEAADANQDWPFKARLAIVALLLGRRGPTEDMLEFVDRPDPVQRTVFIETVPNWHADLEQLKQHIVEAENPGLRSGICLAVGSIEDIEPGDKSGWQDLLTQWYSSQPDGGTHSAAGWALRQWNGTEPPIDSAGLHGEERGWTVTDQTGLTMIRIPAGQFERQVGSENEKKQEVVQITQDFLLSDREITIELFRQFIDDKAYEGEKPKWDGEYKFPGATPAHPVQQVSWYDAVMFCNWLSEKESRTLCYKISTDTASGGAARSREIYEVGIIEGADGFRLPTEAEWEYACRAGTTTRFSSGDDEATLARYTIFTANSNSQSAQVGSRLCNAWGLFDMHGNVWEWCWDWYADYESEAEVQDPLGPTKGSFRVSRGGGWGDAARGCVSSSRCRLVP